MSEIIFDTKLLDNGSLYCPKELSNKEAKYKVIVNLPDNEDFNEDIEKSAAADNSSDFLTKEELEYYLQPV
jgi:hypothetical protein